METQTPDQLVRTKCVPCEGGVPKYSETEARAQLAKLTGWRLTHEGQRIVKDWVVKNFMGGIQFFNRVAELAEGEGHHPDLHLAGYRNVSIEIYTHAIGGLSENDFILAAKIDQLPIELKK
jgi:4a-hydroxytetrahydrobiopterin dehydratase